MASKNRRNDIWNQEMFQSLLEHLNIVLRPARKLVDLLFKLMCFSWKGKYGSGKGRTCTSVNWGTELNGVQRW